MRHLQSFRLRNRQILICRKTRYWYGKYSISNYFVCCGISMVLYLVTDSLMKKDFCLIMLIFLLQNRNVRQWIKSLIRSSREFVFLLIGIMNFINTMVVSVNTRKHEFATLESIGMTKKQIRNVLLWEGGYYWSISFLLLATLGTAIYIPIYSAFRRMVPYAAFHYPVISLLVVAAIVLLVCLATPVITFMQNVKQSVVERLRQN